MRYKWFNSEMKDRKMLVKHPSLRVNSLGILQRSACTRTVFKPDREGYFINTSRNGYQLQLV